MSDYAMIFDDDTNLEDLPGLDATGGGFLNDQEGPFVVQVIKQEVKKLGNSPAWVITCKLNGVEFEVEPAWLMDPTNPNHAKNKTLMLSGVVNPFYALRKASGELITSKAALAGWWKTTRAKLKAAGKPQAFPFQTMMQSYLDNTEGGLYATIYGFPGISELLKGHNHKYDQAVFLDPAAYELLKDGKEVNAEGKNVKPRRPSAYIKPGSEADLARKAGGSGGSRPAAGGTAPHLAEDLPPPPTEDAGPGPAEGGDDDFAMPPGFGA